MNKKEADLLEQLRKLPQNKKCVDCNKKGTTYIITNFGIFTCSTCAGLHREINHKVKGIGMSMFTTEQLALVKKHGNLKFNQEYMGKHSSVHYPIPLSTDRVKMKNYLENKYTKKLFYQKRRDHQSEESDSSEEEQRPQQKPSRRSVAHRPSAKAKFEEKKIEEREELDQRKRANTAAVAQPASLIDFEQAPAPNNAPPHNPSPSLFNAFPNKTVASNLSGAAQLGWSSLTPQQNHQPPAQPIPQPLPSQNQQNNSSSFSWANAFQGKEPTAQQPQELISPPVNSSSNQQNLFSLGTTPSQPISNSGTSTPGIVNSNSGSIQTLSSALNASSSPSLASLLKTAYSSHQPVPQNNDSALVQQLSVIVTQQNQLISQLISQIPHNPQILQLQQGLAQQLSQISSIMTKSTLQNPLIGGGLGTGFPGTMNPGFGLASGPGVSNDPFSNSQSLPSLAGSNYGVNDKAMSPVEKKEQELFSDLMEMSSSNGQARTEPASQTTSNPNNPFDLLL